MYNVGPTPEPWTMPVFIGRIDDKLEAYLTCWVLPVRKEEIH